MLSGAPEQSARAERFERLTLLSRSPDQTRQLGQALGRVVQGRDVLLLDGPFGAGKTVLVQGVAAGLGVQGYVSSPSFIMINEHHGRLPLYHVDLYRMEHQLDAETLDALDEYLNGEGVCVVEWPRLVPRALRSGATELRFIPIDETSRRIEIVTSTRRLAEALEQAGATAS